MPQNRSDPSGTGNGYREYGENAVLRVKQIRHLLVAGLFSEDIAYLLPCAVGEAPELPGCPELLAAMRSRLQRMDERMATLLPTTSTRPSAWAARAIRPFDDADQETVSA